jgi:energy-coupling factor transporter ATP-binding protein EcfA2
VQSCIKLGKYNTPAKFTNFLLEKKTRNDDLIWRISHDLEIVITILHVTINKARLDKEYRKRIFDCNLERLKSYDQYFEFLPIKLTDCLNLLIKFRSGDISEADAISKIRNTDHRFLSSRPQLFKRILNRIRSIFSANKAIVFLGPDGAGKSTLISALTMIEWPMTRSQYMGPSNYSDMRLLLKIPLKFFSKIRDKYNKKHLIGFCARIGWSFFCYFDFLERLYRHKWFCGSGGLVFFDRYACDMYFRNPSKLNEILFIKMLPKPKFVFLCTGDPHTIVARKPELSVEEFKQTILLYRKKIYEYRISYQEINTSDNSISICLEKITKSLIAQL